MDESPLVDALVAAIDQAIRSAVLEDIQNSESVPTGYLSSPLRAFEHTSLGQQAAQEDAQINAAIVRKLQRKDSLQRMVALYGRKKRFVDFNETFFRLNPAIQVVKLGLCLFQLEFSEETANEELVAESNTFIPALLQAHACIRQLHVNVRATSPSPRRFWRAFRLRDGIAYLDAGVAALDDVYPEFVLPCAQRILQGTISKHVDLFLPTTCPDETAKAFREMFLQSMCSQGVVQFNEVNSTLARILETALQMPSISCLTIHLASNRPVRPHWNRFSLMLNNAGPRKITALRYCVDAHYVPLVRCESVSNANVCTYGRLESFPLPTSLTYRELTGCGSNFLPYIKNVVNFPLRAKLWAVFYITEPRNTNTDQDVS